MSRWRRPSWVALARCGYKASWVTLAAGGKVRPFPAASRPPLCQSRLTISLSKTAPPPPVYPATFLDLPFLGWKDTHAVEEMKSHDRDEAKKVEYQEVKR
ncbi:hypothetical protein THAOC_36662, partial [Thalassiosira oceanica]